MNLKIKAIVLIIFVAVVGALYFYNIKFQKAEKARNTEPQTDVASLPKTAEDFIKQSAKQIADPSAAVAGTSVAPQPKPKSKISDICFNQQVQTFGCYEDYYKLLTKDQGVTSAFADLKARYNQNSYLMSQCHPITHVIGNEAAIMSVDVAKAYLQGDSFCWSGYYHGVMEGIIGKITRVQLPNKMNNICDTIPGKAAYSFDYYNCVHGLGHGVMAISQDELFDSLKLCDNLAGGWELSSCYGGVFMENVIIDNKNHFTKYLKPEEPLYPCSAVDDKYKDPCYLMQTSYMLKVTNGDFQKVFELCSTVGNFTATCYQSLGRDASGRSISNVETTKATCALGQDYDQQSNCIVGAVKDFISYHHSDVQAKQLCAAIELDLQAICLSTTESYYLSFN